MLTQLPGQTRVCEALWQDPLWVGGVSHYGGTSAKLQLFCIKTARAWAGMTETTQLHPRDGLYSPPIWPMLRATRSARVFPPSPVLAASWSLVNRVFPAGCSGSLVTFLTHKVAISSSRETNCPFRATKSVSQFSSTIAATFALIMLTPSSPWEVLRPWNQRY